MDLEAKIKPALNLMHGKALSADEFQSLLFEYFEDKGIMSDLRAHLRTQMIHVLKETCLGKAIMSKKNEISPKLQALNLLIAEYLLQRNYHYTLSVLSSEVPLNNAFPPMSIDECINKEQSFRFADEDMWDILVALGLNKVPDVAEHLCIKYKQRENGKDSLLTCILQNIPSIMERSDTAKSECIKNWLNKHNLQTMDLELLIKMFKETGVDIDIILQIIEQLKVVITNEVSRLKEMKDQELMNLKRRLNHEAACKLQKYKVKFANLEAFYKSEKQRLEAELQNAKDNLQSCSKNVQEKYKDINELNEHIKGLEKRLKQQEQTLLTKEQILHQRQEYLETKQKRIDEQFDDLLLVSQAQQAAFAANQTKSMHQAVKASKSTQQVDVLAITETKSTQQVKETKTAETQDQPTKHISEYSETAQEDNQEEMLKQQNDDLRRASNNLQDEIAVLKGQNQAYQSKIQELLLRTNTLLSQLEARNDVRRFNLSASCDAVNVSQLPSTSTFAIASRTRYIPSYHGGGEEGNGQIAISPRDYSNIAFTRESRRKKTPHTVIQTSSSDDLSPTDDILKEARERLVELEKESDVIDKHFETLTKTNLRPSDANAANIIQNFQSNVALLRASLTKMFNNASDSKTRTQQPSSSNSHTNQNQNQSKLSVLVDLESESTPRETDELVGRIFEAAIVDLKEGKVVSGASEEDDREEGGDVEDVYNSATSSGVLINTSMSTVDMSLDVAHFSSSICDWLDIGES